MAQAQIVVADDEVFLTQLVSSNLRRRGYEVFVADNGDAAFKLALKHQPQLVVSDYQMPILDGLKLSMRLKENASTSHIPVLMLTARGHLITPEDLARTNIRALLSKPFSMRELMPKLEAVLPGTAAPERIAG